MHHLFMDFEAAYARIDHTELWEIRDENGVSGKLTRLIKATTVDNLYNCVRVSEELHSRYTYHYSGSLCYILVSWLYVLLSAIVVHIEVVPMHASLIGELFRSIQNRFCPNTLSHKVHTATILQHIWPSQLKWRKLLEPPTITSNPARLNRWFINGFNSCHRLCPNERWPIDFYCSPHGKGVIRETVPGGWHCHRVGSIRNDVSLFRLQVVVVQ